MDIECGICRMNNWPLSSSKISFILDKTVDLPPSPLRQGNELKINEWKIKSCNQVNIL